MSTSQPPVLSDPEQQILKELTVRLIRAEERARFDQLIIRQHYLHSAELVGEQLRYVVEHREQKCKNNILGLDNALGEREIGFRTVTLNLPRTISFSYK